MALLGPMISECYKRQRYDSTKQEGIHGFHAPSLRRVPGMFKPGSREHEEQTATLQE
jgi:hypothetical protein